MKIVCLHNKDMIADVLLHNPGLNIYAIGDLDDFFWPSTTWYGLRQDRELRQIALVYAGPDLPVLMALETGDPGPTIELLRGIAYLLPRRVYAHLSQQAAAALEPEYHIEPDGHYLRMELTDFEQLETIDTAGVARLGVADQPAIEELYRVAYPGNWFDPRMLQTDRYFGIWQDGALVSVAGIHVYSTHYRVAALGNITTHPAQRGRGLAARTTAALCQSMRHDINHIGLNVNAENAAAIACYRSIGFERIAEYGEFMLTAK